MFIFDESGYFFFRNITDWNKASTAKLYLVINPIQFSELCSRYPGKPEKCRKSYFLKGWAAI